MEGGICISNCDWHLGRRLCCFIRFYWTLQSGGFSFLTYLNGDHYLLTSSTPVISLCYLHTMLKMALPWMLLNCFSYTELYIVPRYGLAKFILIWALITLYTSWKWTKCSEIFVGNWALLNHLTVFCPSSHITKSKFIRYRFVWFSEGDICFF